MDIRLKTTSFEFDGLVFQLCCNMNVLADVQEAYGGNFLSALTGRGSLRAINTFLTAMINDAADSMGIQNRYTVAQVGRMLDPSSKSMAARNTMVVDLVRSAIVPNEEPEASEKN